MQGQRDFFFLSRISKYFVSIFLIFLRNLRLFTLPDRAQRIHRRQLSSESEDLFTLQPTTVTEYILYAGTRAVILEVLHTIFRGFAM